MSNVVLDASALLAYLRDEPGAAIVEAAIAQGIFISSVNWAEVLTKVVDLGAEPNALIMNLQSQGLLGSGIKIESLSEKDAVIIANLRSVTRSLGLSLGDRACLALAHKLKLPVLTADAVWQNVNLQLEIQIIR